MKHNRALWLPLVAALALFTAACQPTGSEPPPGSAPDGTGPAEATAASVPTADAALAQPTPVVDLPQTVEEAFVPNGPRFVPVKLIAEAIDKGMPVQIVDARSTLDYDFSHVPGSINAPYFEVEKHLDQLPKDKWIVTYCECPHAEANQAADVLFNNGYTQVMVMDEGLQGWKAMGRPVEGSGQVQPAPVDASGGITGSTVITP